MKARTVLPSMTVFLAAVALGGVPEGHIGIWKLNESKSKFAPGSTKNYTVVYTVAGEELTVTVDGVTGDGKPAHNEWTGKIDGKEYPVSGGVNEETRSYTKIDDRTLEFVGKRGGKVTVKGRVMVSEDGKTRTVTTTAIDSQGKKVQNTAVFDKE